MEENLKILLLSMATMSFYFISIMLILKVRMVTDELPVFTRKKKIGTMDNLSKRLQVVLDGINEDAEKESQIAALTGKKVGVSGKAKLALVSTFSGSEITAQLMKTMVTAFSISLVLSLIAMKSYGPIVAVFLFISLSAVIPSSMNVITARRDVKLEVDILTMMEVNFLHFTNSPNFEESVKKTIDAISPTTKTYKVFSTFLDQVYGLNVPKLEAIEDIKVELGNIPHVNQYFDIVMKAEENDPSYKKSLAGIPDFYAMLITQKQDFVNAISIIFGAYCIMGAIIVGLVIKSAVQSMTVLQPTGSGGIDFYLYLLGFGLYSLSGIVMFVSTLKKQEKRWGIDG